MTEIANSAKSSGAGPTDDEWKLMQTWVREFLVREAEATAGDPGPVVLRRLNNEEYNY